MTLGAQRRIAICCVLLGAGLLLRALVAAPAESAEPAASAHAAEPSPDALPDVAAAPQATSKLLAELRTRNDELEARERDLGERERSLGELAAEAKSMLAELDGRRNQVEQRITALEKLQGDGVARLAKVYGAMPPARAAELLERLDLEVASVVLSRMKPKTSASVMAAMNPEQALRLSERATRAIDDAAPVVAQKDQPAAKPEEAERFR